MRIKVEPTTTSLCGHTKDSRRGRLYCLCSVYLPLTEGSMARAFQFPELKRNDIQWYVHMEKKIFFCKFYPHPLIPSKVGRPTFCGGVTRFCPHGPGSPCTPINSVHSLTLTFPRLEKQHIILFSGVYIRSQQTVFNSRASDILGLVGKEAKSRLLCRYFYNYLKM